MSIRRTLPRPSWHVAFLALPVTMFLISFVYPVGYTACLSLFSWDGISPHSRFVGLTNYALLLHSSRFIHALVNNLAWLAFYVLMPSTVGLSLALLIDGKLKGEAVFKTIIFLPYVITPVATAAVWRWIYLPDAGPLNALLRGVGLVGMTHNWLGDRELVTASIMVAALWSATGFSFLVFFSGLRALPVELIEAARIDGASPSRILFQIILPLLLPSAVLVIGLFAVEAMRIFDLVWAMSGGGPARASEVLSTELYDVGFGTFQMGLASAIGMCQLLLAALLILPYIAYVTSRIQEPGE